MNESRLQRQPNNNNSHSSLTHLGTKELKKCWRLFSSTRCAQETNGTSYAIQVVERQRAVAGKTMQDVTAFIIVRSLSPPNRHTHVLVRSHRTRTSYIVDFVCMQWLDLSVMRWVHSVPDRMRRITLTADCISRDKVIHGQLRSELVSAAAVAASFIVSTHRWPQNSTDWINVCNTTNRWFS